MSDDNHNNPSPEEQQLQDIKDIKSKLGHVSGFTIAMRSEIADSFQKLHIQNQKHFRILQNKAEFHCYIMIIFIFFLFLFFLFFQTRIFQHFLIYYLKDEPNMTYYMITLLLIFFQSVLILKSLQYSKKAYFMADEINKNLQFKIMTKTFYLDEIDKNLEKILEKLK